MASSPLISAINSVLTKVSAIPYSWDSNAVTKPDLTKLFQYVAVWNNHVEKAIEAHRMSGGVIFNTPACFVEFMPMDWNQLNMGVNTCDLKIRFHLVDMQLDAMDGNMNQNLEVFIYRDLLMQNLGKNFYPSFCGVLSSVSEEQDFNHTDVYHHKIEMNCTFVDTKGSTLDPDSGDTITKDPPTTLEVDAIIETEGIFDTEFTDEFE